MSANTRKFSRRILNLSLAVAVSTALLFALLYGDGGGSAQAQTADTPTPEATAESDDDFGNEQLPPIEGKLNPPQYPNMDSNLNRIFERVQSGQFTTHAAAASAPVHSGSSVAVTLYTDEGYTQDVWDWLEESGADPRNIGADYIEAYVPVSLLAETARQEGVIGVYTIIPPQPAQGVVVSEGVAAHDAPAWHNAGYKGQGVRVGIIDTGFEGFRGLMGTELPASVEARCYTDVGVHTSVIEDCTNSDDRESTRKHGTAVTEAIFDIAPEATYYIANTSSWDDMIATAEWMVQQDVDVINHSVGWMWQGPGDGTSPFSNAVVVGVNTAVAGGITWVNAAGNDAKGTWFGRFSNPDFVNDGYHNFNGTDECNTVDIPELDEDESFTAQLRWDDRWLGAARDLDLYLFDVSNLSVPVASSEDEQSGGRRHVPREVLSYKPPSAGRYCLAVRHERGFAPVWIQLQARGGDDLEYHTISGSIGNPAESANPGLLAVGAAGRNSSVVNPLNTGIIEPFSSQGPTPDGRIKPDIVGADAGQSVTYRSERNPNGYFFGTSQASPHVAGLATLVKQRFPDYHPANITSYLKANAERRGAVPNNTWGYGFAKLPAIAPEPTVTPTPEPTPVTPQVPQEVLNRLSTLETLVATLQSLISTLESKITALDSRVAALETNASVPTPIPTATLTPTPTTMPGVPTPIPTPIPTATPVLTATPIADACVTPITGDGVSTASWISNCQSTNRPLDPAADGGTYYARYYTFELSAASSVSITLESSEDTFLYLLNDKGKTGSVAHFNDDIDYPNNSNSRIEETLQAGSYTIEAATYHSGVVGSSFTLTLIGIE